MKKKYIITVASSDCTVEQYLFYGTEEEMLEVLERKAEEERKELAEYAKHVTHAEYDEIEYSWNIKIYDDGLETLETIVAKSMDSIMYLDL